MGENFTGVKNQKLTRLSAVLAAVVLVASAADLALVQPPELASQLAERDALQQKSDAQALSNLKLAPVITKKAEVLAKHLREKIAKEPDINAQILRTWIREEDS